MEHTTDTPIQTSPATSLDILSALQRTLNGQIHNATSHGLILISANLVKESIDALRVSNLKTFSTLRDYLRDGETLTPTEFTILELLVAAGGEAVAYDELNQRAGIAGCEEGCMKSLWVHKRRLLMKLQERFEIVTLRKRGYALLAK